MSTTTLYLPKYTIESKRIVSKEGQILIPKGITASGFERCWKEGLTGKGIIVAVVDTGIDTNNVDLRGKVIKSFNLTGEEIRDTHGTHIAGTIAANGWLRGGAYDANLIDIKVVAETGGTVSTIVKAIGLAASNGASVVNLSVGSSQITNSEIQSLTSAIQDAWEKGCICVAAAGNEGTSLCTPDSYEYPASIEKTESIAACDVSEDFNNITLAPFSNENNKIDMAACGVNVISTTLNNEYVVYSGTSMAAAHVSAMAAVLAQYIKEKYPDLSGSSFSANLVSLLHANVVKIQGCGPHTISANGKVLVKVIPNKPCTSSTINTLNIGTLYTNISYGLGFLRYKPNEELIKPSNNNYYDNGVFIGNLININ